MTNHKKQRNIGLFYIVVLALCTISNVQSKIFNEKIKKILASRNYDDVLLMQQQVDSLKEAFKSKFKIGTSVSPHEFNVGSDFIKKHFNSITPENELKPDAIINQQACQSQGNNVNTQVVFNSGTQTTLKFCEDNGIPLRGHTFVWYSQTPDWFFKENFNSGGNYVSKNIMDQRLESFIKNTFDLLARSYPRLEVYAYDVANELFLNDGGGMRPADNSNWARIYGIIMNIFQIKLMIFIIWL